MSVLINFIFTDTFSGNVGLAISQSLILTGMVQYGIRQTTEAMQQMTSVERILQYTDLEPVIFIKIRSGCVQIYLAQFCI